MEAPNTNAEKTNPVNQAVSGCRSRVQLTAPISARMIATSNQGHVSRFISRPQVLIQRSSREEKQLQWYPPAIDTTSAPIVRTSASDAQKD
jgi:hypothetical protein